VASRFTGPALDDAAVRQLADGFAGELIRPTSDGYDEARRIWNRMIDRRPALIARCADARDARLALVFAREHGLPSSVRGGGHNVSGSALVDGGVVIDHSLRRAVRVDPATRTVEVEPGVLLGELDRATSTHGLAVPVGIQTTTGVAGLALGGGIGWLMRRDGLTCDHLIAADLVTADGEMVLVDEERDPDLLWALRGGGGNFGVVTRFVFRAREVAPRVLAGLVLFALDEGEAVLRRYREWAAVLPDTVTTIVALRTVLPVPAFAAELHGRRVVAVAVCQADPRGESVLAPIRELGKVLFDNVASKPFVDHQALFDASVPAGLGYYWKSHFLRGLDDGAIDALVEQSRNAPQPWSYALIFQLGGAVARVHPDATAFAERTAPFALNINGVAESPADDALVTAWTRATFEAVEPFSTGGVYVNFVGDEGEARTRAAYGSAYDRLAALKSRYDPENVFRSNQNVRPAR
jgi:FAD/FMN-containing dehydrogenase